MLLPWLLNGIQSHFKNELQLINLGAGNKYLNLTDGTLDKWIPGNIKSLLMHPALQPYPQSVQESRYSLFIFNKDLDSIPSQFYSNAQFLSHNSQIVQNV